MKLMIDTNVIIDVLQKREPFFTDSYKAIYKALKEKNECLVSASAVTDIFYILRKSFHSTMKARICIENLSRICSFADILSSDIYSAIMSDIEDFEDGVVDAAAHRIGASYIITRNDKDFQKAKTRAVTPTEFLNLSITAKS